MLEIKGLHKIYGKYHALSGLDMNVSSGALYGFVGPNGAGKTTTMKIMAGLLTADEGKITIDGINALRDLKDLKARIGYVPDFFGVYDNLTVSEYMEFFASCHHLDGLVARKRYTALLEQVGLEDKLDVKAGVLSGGQRQAMALLMSTMTPIEFLILDEHTAALDPKTAEVIMELTDRIIREKKLTALMVTHNLRYAVEYGNRLLMMHQGQAVMDKAYEEKESVRVDDILGKFNEISIECGN